jgi:hypothetical protein
LLSKILNLKKSNNSNKPFYEKLEIHSNLEPNIEIQIFELDKKNKYNFNGYEVIKND